jgi:heptaprenyl diphosphate synthase
MNATDRETVLKTTLLLVAVTLNAFEFFLPRIPLFPWLKPGLANCVTIFWIIRFGGVDAVLFTLLRVWTVGFYFGFSFLTLALSLTGGLLSTIAMAVLWRLLGRRKWLGVIGLGMCGALFHNTGQLAAVYVLMARNLHLLYQVPIMAAASLVFGVVVSLAVPLVDSLAQTVPHAEGRDTAAPDFPARPPTRYTVLSLAALGLCVALVFVSNAYVLAATAAAVTVAVQATERGSLAALLRPLRRFWLLFVCVGALHAFLSYGKRVAWAPGMTYEGLREAGVQWLRLWTWLQVAGVFTRLRFHLVFFRVLRMLFRSQPATVYSGLLALEHFPAALDIVRARAARQTGILLRHPIRWATQALEGAFADVRSVVAASGREKVT